MLLAFADYAPQAQRLTQALGESFALIGVHRFPDGEQKLTLPPRLPGRVVICQSLDQPDSKLVALMLAARTARLLGATHLTLVAPYLCYMRQDAAFAPGEAVSQKIVGAFLAELFDAVVTVDPHLHRTRDLSQAVPAGVAIALSASSQIGTYLRQVLPRDALLLGPDEESAQWVSAAAQAAGLPFAVCEKVRSSDHAVQVRLPNISFAQYTVTLLDDMASTAGTLIAAARECLQGGASAVHAAVTHALFAGDALARLHAAGVSQIWSTDSVAHATNAIALDHLLAHAVQSVWAHADK